MKNKIVLLTANTGGGILQFTVQLYHSLRKLGFGVKVFAPQESINFGVSEVPENDLVLYQKTKRVLDSSPYRALAEKINDESAEYVWFCDDSIVCAGIGIALRNFSVKQLLTVHDAGGYHPTNRITLRTRLMRGYAKVLNIDWYKHICRFVLLSPESERTFQSRYPKQSKKTVMMNLGAHIPNDSPVIPPEMENNDAKSYFLFFGRIDKYKGIENFLKAYNACDGVVLPLVIAGGGALSEAETALAQANDNITVINRFIDNGEMKWLFENSRAVVLPYIEATQSGVIPIAYAYGKPVLVSDIAGLVQFVEPNVTGIVCKTQSDWMRALSDYSGESELCSAAGITEYYSEKMNWEKNIRNMFEAVACYER